MSVILEEYEKQLQKQRIFFECVLVSTSVGLFSFRFKPCEFTDQGHQVVYCIQTLYRIEDELFQAAA